MKEFNLEAALRGEKVVTRDGLEVTDIHWFNNCTSKYNLYGVIHGGLWSFTKDGKATHAGSTYDLFMAPKQVTMWMNVYTYEDGSYHPGVLYKTELEAKVSVIGNGITIPVTFEQ